MDQPRLLRWESLSKILDPVMVRLANWFLGLRPNPIA